MDFNTQAYYDAAVVSALYQQGSQVDSGSGYSSSIAVAFTQVNGRSNTDYTIKAKHYLYPIFYAPEFCSNPNFPWFDYYGYFGVNGFYPCGYDFFYGTIIYCEIHHDYGSGDAIFPRGRSFCVSNYTYPGDTNNSLHIPNPSVQISEVGFTNDYPIVTWVGHNAIDQPDGSEPIWKASGNPDYPTAYKMGAKPTMFAKLNVVSNPTNVQTANLRVKNGATVIATSSGVNLNGSTVQVANIQVATDLESPTGVKKAAYTFTWEMSFDNGATWASIGNSGPHTIHWTYDAPLTPPFMNTPFNETPPPNQYPELYDRALDKSDGKVASGNDPAISDVNTIVSKINAGIATDLYYHPSRQLPSNENPLAVYNPLNRNDRKALCADNTNILRGLIRSIGIDGTTYFLWGGDPNSRTRWPYCYGTQNGNTITYGHFTLRADRDSQKDGADAHPHFTYHAVLSANGAYYDPSYGDSGISPKIDETFHANPKRFDEGSSALANLVFSTTFGSGQITPTNRCPHSTIDPGIGIQGCNPIDDPRTFVRQQYLDVLNR